MFCLQPIERCMPEKGPLLAQESRKVHLYIPQQPKMYTQYSYQLLTYLTQCNCGTFQIKRVLMLYIQSNAVAYIHLKTQIAIRKNIKKIQKNLQKKIQKKFSTFCSVNFFIFFSLSFSKFKNEALATYHGCQFQYLSHILLKY